MSVSSDWFGSRLRIEGAPMQQTAVRRPSLVVRGLVALATVLASTAVVAAIDGGRAAAATTITVDDAVQGSGQDQFAYLGSGWGHASGEGAPANPYDGTNSWTGQTGDSVTFTFVGTQLTFYGITDPGHGI